MTDQPRDDQFDRLLHSFLIWQAEDLVSPPTAAEVAMRIGSRTGAGGPRARVVSVDTTPQPRTIPGRPWKMPTMASALAKLAVSGMAVAAIVVVGLALLRPAILGPAAPASPTPLKTSQPSPTAWFSRFDSPLHGISIDYPSGWQIRPATEPWTGGALDFDAPAADVLFDPALGDRLYLVLASAPHTAAGSAGILDDDVSLPKICREGGGSGGTQTVDGAHAWVVTRGCGNGGGGRHSAVVATASRGFVIYLYMGPESPQATYDRDWFAGILGSVDLRPEEALDGPSASSSPTVSPTPVAPPPSAFTERFDSPLHGLSIGYPSGWQVRPATSSWRHGVITFGAPDVDVIFDPAHPDTYFALVSGPLEGQRADDWWRAAIVDATRTCDAGDAGNGRPYALDGAAGYSQHCRSDGYVAAVATAARGYLIELHVGDRLWETYPSEWFWAALETVDLRPEDAVHAP